MTDAPQDPRVEIDCLERAESWLHADDAGARETFQVVNSLRKEVVRLRDLLSRLDAVGEPVAEGFVEREELEAFPDPWPLDHSPGMTLWPDDDDEYADMIPVKLYRRQGREDG